MNIPDDKHLVAAFERGQAKAVLRTKFGRTECPYGEARPYMRDAWLTGYDFAERLAA